MKHLIIIFQRYRRCLGAFVCSSFSLGLDSQWARLSISIMSDWEEKSKRQKICCVRWIEQMNWLNIVELDGARKSCVSCSSQPCRKVFLSTRPNARRNYSYKKSVDLFVCLTFTSHHKQNRSSNHRRADGFNPGDKLRASMSNPGKSSI